MYDYQETQKRLGKRDYFPNSGTVAYFDPQSQTIHLNGFKKGDFVAALQKQQPTADFRNMFGTMMHEATHWADLIGTLWGRTHLRCLYDCYRLLPRVNDPGVETDLHRFIDLHDHERRMMHSRYFRTVHPNPKPHDHKTPWRLQFTAGREFDPAGKPDENRPIVFTRFLDNKTSDQIARQPIVAGALLEINAVWSEMRTNLELMGALDKDEFAVEQRLYGQQILRFMYNPDLTLYTAPAHLLAHYCRISDVLLAYELSSALAHIVLNLTPESFEALSPPESMSDWAELFAGFKKTRDCGFAFKVIASVTGRWEEGMNKQEWLDTALNRAGLPESQEILRQAILKMEEYSPGNLNTSVNIAENYLLEVGKKIFATRSLGDTAITHRRIIAEGLPIVPMFDPEGDLIAVSKTFDLAKFSPEDMHALSASLVTQAKRFREACR
ncbi:hypothetical protein [Rhizobium sp. GN54]|uniref:hypothetical protein n=1 Tax=Rhizobium sp. GN54 TaxID=2898150 RepID=UPI001E58F3F0|nr:hypothetical protein [Rhizobium sp. GN54]MCD2184881.1 hypothetical protein [Rhizobium sp. GN54]